MFRARLAALRARLAALPPTAEILRSPQLTASPLSSSSARAAHTLSPADAANDAFASATWPPSLSLDATAPSSSSSTTTPVYDTIVVGLGAHGSSAFYHLARAAAAAGANQPQTTTTRVLGIEASPTLAHGGASHGGDTRITRQAYFESPLYVPLLRRSYALTAELEREVQKQLFWRTGVIHAGGKLFEGALAAARQHSVEHEVLVAAAAAGGGACPVSSRWPGFRFPNGCPVLWEPGAGILAPDLMIRAHAAAAVATGHADVLAGDGVRAWGPDGGGKVAVETRSGRVFAARRALVLAAGAWMPRLVPELAGLAVPRRYTVAWLEGDEESYALGRFPPFLVEEPGTGVAFYGFPAWPYEGASGSAAVVGGGGGGGGGGEGRAPATKHRRRSVKLGAFLPSSDDLSQGGKVDPGMSLSEQRRMTAEDERAVRAFAGACLPGLAAGGSEGAGGGGVADFAACIFTDTPDAHFLVDAHPRFRGGEKGGARVVLCSACSGHGFKLSPAVGEILADWAVGGERGARARYGESEDVLALHRLRADRPGVAEVLERFHGGSRE
jgi:sarcosine oxidase